MTTISCTSIFLQLAILIVHAGFSYALSCKGSANEDLDWYVGYKLPQLVDEQVNPSLQNGTAFAYITPASTGLWTLSSKSVSSPSSLLGYTLQQIPDNEAKVTYLFYNDDPPEHLGKMRGSSGHLKGVLAFDRFSGFWLIHSIPRFGDPEKYYYPDNVNAVNSGQSVLCITLRTKELNEICKQLLYSDPNIYAEQLTEDIEGNLDDNAYSLFTDAPKLIRKKPFVRKVHFKSYGNQHFVSFTKTSRYKHDLYSRVVAPGIRDSLTAMTWRSGAGGRKKPSCKSKFDVSDVQSVNMKFPSVGATFEHVNDHSKWAVSRKNYVCIGDLNRMRSQFRRGGGAVCFESEPVAAAFKSAIGETEKCST